MQLLRFFQMMFVLAIAAGGMAPPVSAAESPTGRKPNVLFIAVDDLNHWVGHLGRNKQTKTPNIDRLAKLGVTFTHAYCAAPVCNPSRAALMSGRRPGETGVYDNAQDWRPVLAPEQTLTTQFLKAGYTVLGAGKIYHSSVHRPQEWSGYLQREGPEPQKLSPKAKGGGVGGIRFAPLDCQDADMPDHRIADYGIAELAKTHDQPLFLAIGFHKPHMPWNVPKKYYDLFPLDQIELPPHTQDDLSDVPAAGVKMAKPDGDHANILASGRWKEAVQGYLAAIAFLDAEVGRVLDAYEKSPEKDRTIICFWGDHGWHLGEKEHWRKFALWEEATRAPFIWVVPGLTKPGGVCQRTVDFMSIYPTLCHLAGLPVPPHASGRDIRPLLADPQSAWEFPALTTFHRNNHSLRNEAWRYIRYADGGEEIYDEKADPYEWTNLAAIDKAAPARVALAKFLPEKNAPELPNSKKDGEAEPSGNSKP
jgi:arylsulfatase A-like enzyme